MVIYMDTDGNTVGKQFADGVKAETGKSYALLGSGTNKSLMNIPEDYDFVSAVPFEANGYKTADVIVKKAAFNATFAMGSGLNSRADAAIDKAGAKVKSGDTVTVTFSETNNGCTGYDANIKVTGDSDMTVTKTAAVINHPNNNDFAITYTIDAVSGDRTVY